MTPEYVYNVWAPAGGPWSPWVKPVLFAYLQPLAHYGNDALLPALAETSWMPPADGSAVLVLDLPGALGVAVAFAAARGGFRPVPLYNAVPSPTPHALASAAAVCDLSPVVAAMSLVTPELDGLNLAFTAPPAFVLDADRRFGRGARPMPGMFDNRSISLPTDFPSANVLLSSAIRRALLVQENRLDPQEDLAHTLLRWQQAGMTIESVQLAAPPPVRPVPITVSKPSMFRRAWYRFLATAGLRRSPLGGFGGLLPLASAG